MTFISYNIRTELDNKVCELIIQKSDIEGTPTAELAENSAAGTVIDEGSQWRIVFNSLDFSPLAQDYTVQITNGDNITVDYAIVNLSQAACNENINGASATMDISVEVSSGQITVRGIYRGLALDGSGQTVLTSIDGGSTTQVPTFVAPLTYEQLYLVFPDPAEPRVTSNACPENDSILEVETEACLVVIDSIQVLNETSAGNDGQITVNAHGATNLEYRLFDLGTPVTAWQVSNQFLALAANPDYIVHVRDADLISCEQVQAAPVGQNLFATFTKMDVSIFGGADGSIDVTPSGGSGMYDFQWADGPTTEDRAALVAGNYSVTITDQVTPEQFVLNVAILQPAPPPEELIDIPLLNPLRLVLPVEEDGCEIFDNEDNTLHCQQIHEGVRPRFYAIKIARCDDIPIQIHTTYETNTVTLFDEDENIINVIVMSLAQQYVGLEQMDDVVLTIGENAGEVNVNYTLLTQLPEYVELGQDVFLQGATVNGVFPIIDLFQTGPMGPYVVVNTVLLAQENATATATYNKEEFDVYEAIIPLAAVPDGRYFVQIVGTSPGFNDYTAISEPFEVADEFPGTQKINYRIDTTCIDFNIDWSTGFNPSIRVEADYFRTSIGGEDTALRDSKRQLFKTSSYKTFLKLLEPKDIPNWLSVKLGVIFGCRIVLINGQSVSSETRNYEYDDIGSLMTDGTIEVEVANFLRGFDSNISDIEEIVILGNNGECIAA